jgi:hypothetical protein
MHRQGLKATAIELHGDRHCCFIRLKFLPCVVGKNNSTVMVEITMEITYFRNCSVLACKAHFVWYSFTTHGPLSYCILTDSEFISI